MSDASVVVVSVDRGQPLRNALRTIRRQTAPPREVIVVAGPDGGLTRGIAESFPDVQVLDCLERNISTARNLGLAKATSRYVAFIDDDALAEPDWLESLTSGARTRDAQIVGGPVVDRTGTGYQARYLVSDWHGDTEVLDTGDRGIDLGAINRWTRHRFSTSLGASFLCERDFVTGLGGFDENFSYYLDETELCARVILNGGSVEQLAYGAIHHKFLPSGTRDVGRVVRNWLPILTSRRYFALRYALPRYGEEAVEARWNAFVHKHRRSCLRGAPEGAGLDEAMSAFESSVLAARHDAESRVQEQPRLMMAGQTVTAEANSEARMAVLPRIRGVVTLVAPTASPAGRGGIATVVNELAKGLAEQGLAVRVLCEGSADDQGDADEVVEYADDVFYYRYSRGRPRARTFDASPPQLSPSLRHLESSFKLIREWSAWIAQFSRSDVWISQSWDGISSALGDVCTPRVVLAYTTAKNYLDLDIPIDRPLFSVLADLESSAILAADGVIPDSHALHASMSRHYRGASLGQPCYPGILSLPEWTPPAGDQTEWRYALYVGSQDPRKGLDWLLKCWLEQLSGADPWGLLVVCPGIPGTTLRHMKSESNAAGVMFDSLDRVASTTLSLLFSGASAVVVPSVFESFGLPIVEAWRAGRPVVASGAGSPRELMCDARLGIYVEKREAQTFAQAVAFEISHDSEEKIQYRRAHYSNHFTREAGAQRMVELLDRYIPSNLH